MRLKRLIAAAFLLFAVLTTAISLGVASGATHAHVVASTCWTGAQPTC